MPKPLSKKRADEVTRIQNLSNKALLEETIVAAGGDDWEGGFTSFGLFSFESLKDELNYRLSRWIESDNNSRA